MNYAILWTARWTRKLLDFLFWIRLRAASQGCRNLLRTSARKGATGTEPRIRTVRQLAAAAGDGSLGFAGSPGQLETSLNSGYLVGPCNSYLEGPTLVFLAAARAPLFGLAARAIALCLIARSARGDVRWGAAVFVGADGTEMRVPPSPPADRRREHRESAAVVIVRRGKNASALSSSVRRRAIFRRSQPTQPLPLRPLASIDPAPLAGTWVNPGFRRSAQVATYADRQEPTYT
jgi:hypothetical protein